MITHIRVKNFKSWKDSDKVELAPLTGFFGTNSSGKSSLLQMLLLLKQTVERSNSEEVIFFGNESSLVNLGNFREVIHGHKEEELLELELGCRTQDPYTVETLQRDRYNYLTFFPLDVDNFTFDAAIQGTEVPIFFEHVCYAFGSNNEFKIQWKSGSLVHPGQYQSEVRLRGDHNRVGPSQQDLLKYLTSSFEKLFFHVYYLGPTRVDPRRVYGWTGSHPAHIRQWGAQTIDALLSARVRKLKTLHEEEEVPIEDRVSEWLQEMELAHSFTLDWKTQSSTEYEVRIQKTSSSPSVTLVDMGYGLGQFLPVLVLCYYAPEGSTLILEQPGIHLHPKVQSQLADLLIEVVLKRNLQILIESHSEHLLNRLQRRVAEEKIAVDQTALYFCRNDEGVSNIDRLKMDEFGNITNWPENFFGDEMGDLFAMTKAQRERQKRGEG